MVERVPALVALLEDGVTRARDQLERQAGRSLRIRIELGDSLAWIDSAAADDMPQIIYLDPMFPSRSKSALVKLDMRLLRRIAGVAGDVCRLFETAMRSADRRVVVKRPRGAPCLCGTKPDFEIDGSGVRFDVYLTNASQ
jgi:16S rRNA (guanine1516-N2)-methyltransferase